MRRLEILRSGAFRLALSFAALFAVGAVSLFITVNWAVTRYAERTTTRALLDEGALLRSEALMHGRDALAQLILRRQHIPKARQFLYLLADPQGRRMAGDLPTTVAHSGWGEVGVPVPTDPMEPSEQQSKVRTFGVRLSDNSLLVVGRNTYDLEELAEWLDRVTLWSGLGIAILALWGGFLIASSLLRRLDRVNDALERIMDGRLDERVPAIGMGAEYDRLTTTLNQMLTRIETLMDGLRQVSTDIAHDLRTPLTRLRQHLEVTRGLPVEAVEGGVDAALVQVDEVLATFQALLRIGQIEAGAGRSRFASVNLSEVIERVRLAYEPAAEDALKTLTAEIADGVRVTGDAELLTQLFANLIENAITHTGPGAHVEMRLSRDASSVLATLSDDGPGIPVQERERVLRRFHRLDASRSTPGSGLGLSLASAIAELHGATLELADNRPGLIVAVRFPLQAASTAYPGGSGRSRRYA